MREPVIPINGGEQHLRADIAERHGIKPNGAVDWRTLMGLRDEEREERRKERE